MDRDQRRRASAGAWAALLCLVVGCTSFAADKAGGSGRIVTLSLVTADYRGTPGGDQIAWFAQRVRERSEGRLRIRPQWQAAGAADVPAFDQRVARRVIHGRAALGMVPARAWDVLGVRTLQALQTPFLVTSDSLLDAVARDPVSADLLSGLKPLGVTGLALLPEGLRHPVGFTRPLLAAADFRDLRVFSPRSRVSWATLRALGSLPVDAARDHIRPGAVAANAGAAESEIALLGNLGSNEVVTANITFFPKANTLVVNTEALAKLNLRQRAVLRAAALDTRSHVLGTRPHDGELVRRACAAGSSIVMAAPAAVDAVETQVRGVRTRLERDPQVHRLIERIESLAERTSPDPEVSACPHDTTTTDLGASGDVAALNGIWRFTASYDDAVAAGLGPDAAAQESGVQTIRIVDGHYAWIWRARDGEHRCDGVVSVSNSTLSMREAPPCTGAYTATYRLDGDALRFRTSRWLGAASDSEGPPVADLLFGGRTWQRLRRLPTSAVEFPEGVYRWAIRASDLVAAGVDAASAGTNSGIFTMTVRNGRFVHHTRSALRLPDCTGRYRVLGGHRVEFLGDPIRSCGTAAGGLVFRGTWSSTRGGLRFRDIEPDDIFSRVLFGTRTWRRTD